jgi:kynurenine formamidase
LEHWQKVRRQVEQKFGAENVDTLFPEEAYQLTHNALFPHDCVHVENLGEEIGNPALHNKRIVLGAFPWKFAGGEAAFCRAVAFTE